SSLPASSRADLAQLYRTSGWPDSSAFVFAMNGSTIHGSIQPLRDASSNTVVAQLLIQRDERDAAVETNMLRIMGLIMSLGVVGAAVGSLIISAAIASPIQQLVAGVQRVARGDLDLSLPVKTRDELGELSGSFNSMVDQLRSRHELEHQVEVAQSSSRAKSQF